MDSHGHTSGFINLLNSQNPTLLPQNPHPISQNPNLNNENPHPISENPNLNNQNPPPVPQNPHKYGSNSVDELGASEDDYVFGSEWDQEAHTITDRSQRRKWSPTEDLVLISAWLNTSKDPVVGNEQKALAFWKRITAYFSSSPKLAGLSKRLPSQCKQRWGKINDGVCKWVGCYEAAVKQKSSGQSENDVMKLAHAIFFNDYKLKFVLEHAWLELRHDQKWCGVSSTKDKVSSKRRKLDYQSAQSSASVVGEDEARPVGVKAAKAKGKSKAAKSEESVEFEGLWEIKQRDFMLKDKLSKQKLLDSLIAKTEPLTDLETELKNKLITEMLSR